MRAHIRQFFFSGCYFPICNVNTVNMFIALIVIVLAFNYFLEMCFCSSCFLLDDTGWKNKIGILIFPLLPPTKINLLVREPSYQRMLPLL